MDVKRSVVTGIIALVMLFIGIGIGGIVIPPRTITITTTSQVATTLFVTTTETIVKTATATETVIKTVTITTTLQGLSETPVSVNQILLDMNKYFMNIVNLAKTYNPYIMPGAVPTTIAIGVDGRPIAIIQGETEDISLWNTVLNSQFNNSIAVIIGSIRRDIVDSNTIAKIEGNITELCRHLGIENPRSIAIMFGLSTCPHCANQKKFFDNNNIRYIFIELDTRSVIKRL